MAPRVSPRVLVAAAAGLLAGCADGAPLAPIDASAGKLAPPATTAPPGRYLVGFTGPAAIPGAVLAASGGRIVDSIPTFGVLVVDGVTNPDALRMANPAYIEAGYDVTIDPIAGEPAPADAADAVPGALAAPWYANNVQWDMTVMGADAAWSLTDGGAGTIVCIVDTGIDITHQEIAGRVLLRANFVSGAAENRVDDPNGHGSHVSGTVAAGGTVISGVAPRASLIGARVLNTAGSGSETAITNGLRWCADNGAHVANVSIGGLRYRGTASYVNSPITYGNAVAYGNARGMVTVTSAGNSNIYMGPNPAIISVPAAVPGQIQVGATGPLSKVPGPAAPAWSPFDPAQVWQGPDSKAFYSNFGENIAVFAPGGRGGVPLSSPYRFWNGVQQGGSNDNIWSLCSGQTTQSGAANGGVGVPTGGASCSGQTNRYIAYAGTSMAAPHVAGMAAVLYAELGGVRSDANRQRVIDCIKQNTDDIGPASVFGGGRVNLPKAIAAIRAGSC